MSLFEVGVTCTPLAITGSSVYAIWATNHVDERLKILLINLAWVGVLSSLLGIILTLPQDVNNLEDLVRHIVGVLNEFKALDYAIKEGISAGALTGLASFVLAVCMLNLSQIASDGVSRIIWKGPALFALIVACCFVLIGVQSYESYEHTKTYPYQRCR